MLPTVRRTWAPRGQTPVLRHRARSHRKVSVIGALTLSPRRRNVGLYVHWHPDRNVTSDEVVAFLRDLLRSLRGNVILIWDRLNAHRSARVRLWRGRHRRLTIEWLPPYAPELNPVEYAWSHLKYHRMCNHGLDDLAAIQDLAEDEAERMVSRQTLLRSFVHTAKLPIRLPS